MLPPGPRGGPILHGCYARAERAYEDWKGAIDDLWADKHHRLVEEQAARARQEEAARRTQLLNEQDARARQVARRQQLVNEEAARTRREEAAARARQEAARACQALLTEQERCRIDVEERAERELAEERLRLDTATVDTFAINAARTIFLWLADAASTPDSPDSPPGENCARPLSHACDTSRNAPNAPSWPRSNVSRLQRHLRELWPMPLSNCAFGRC